MLISRKLKTGLYVILPILGFGLILSNMLFGHLIFVSSYDQDINKYSIYVHLQPEWDSYPHNILFDVTDVWSNSNSDPILYDHNSENISNLIPYNSNQLQFQNKKSFVELKHEFNNCKSNWAPPLYRYAVDSVRNNFEVMLGTQLNNDPYVSVFSNIPMEQNESNNSEYVQFIPICTSKDITSYEYAITSTDAELSFDAFFVSSEDELQNYLSSDFFTYYLQEECSVLNHQSFSGVCKNIGKNSGLLIIIPDDLESSLTKVTVNLHEV
jgi:hypothetical protein